MKDRFLRALAAMFLLFSLNGCSQEQPEGGNTSPPEPQTATPATDASTASEPQADATPQAAAEPVKTAEPIDLIHGVRADLAVSTAYRDKIDQAEKLIDGDIETAWNSQSDDLVGAWIDVRLPEKASVTSIELTAGFVKATKQNDLFIGNHRVKKVRVLRDGQELGVFDLDIESRELQTIPVSGPGGVYRIEVAEVMAGSKSSWREVCISELRVMGTAPEVHDGERIPRIKVGELPEPRPEPGSADRAKVSAELGKLIPRFSKDWSALTAEEALLDQSSVPGDQYDSTGYLVQRRQQFLNKVADLAEAVDEVRADRLRLAALKKREPNKGWGWYIHENDLGVIAGGFQAVVDWLGEDEPRCTWTKVHTGLRLQSLADEIKSVDFACEHQTMEEPSPSAEETSRCQAVEKVLPKMKKVARLWRRDPQRAAEEFTKIEMPALSGPSKAEWEALGPQIGIAQKSCGWNGEPQKAN